MAISKTRKVLVRMWRTGDPGALLVGVQTDTVKHRMDVPQKLEIEQLGNPTIPLLGIYPKKTKALT